jgi:D-alanyl-D-alanine carboxypeptidase (penicillin-binding protein 5/6)
MKTGFTTPAGDCLAASAERNGIRLISIVFNSQSPGRWQDSRILFDYGFETFRYETIQEADQFIETLPVVNAMIGEADTVDILADDTFIHYMSRLERDRIVRRIIYDEEFIAENENGSTSSNVIRLAAPIEKDTVLGKVIYLLDNEVLFEGTIRAAVSVEERTLDSDMDWYIGLIRENIFTLRALPYWMGLLGFLVGIAGICVAIAERKRSRRDWRDTRRRGIGNRYPKRSRYDTFR